MIIVRITWMPDQAYACKFVAMASCTIWNVMMVILSMEMAAHLHVELRLILPVVGVLR